MHQGLHWIICPCSKHHIELQKILQTIDTLTNTSMTDMANEQEKRVKQLKRSLEGWREVVLPLHSLLTWKEKWYPGVIFGFITMIFLFVWWLDPAVLTLVSVLAILTVLVDYLVPTLASSFCRADSWTGTKEKRLEEVCRSLVSAETCLRSYYVVVLALLFLAAYIGSIINNMLLTYFIVLLITLAPGLCRQGILKQQLAQISSYFAGMLSQPSANSSPPSAADKPKKN
ncbi:hypothetical protein B566_EDAN002835 [Ephemera danica]|nr:hypothetical protein B566_EDAN002835 [Ephemera danica]